MNQKQDWFSKLKSGFENSPLASNVVFNLILVCLEKLVEMEFSCSCDPTWNTPFVIGFFGIPAVLAFLLMTLIRGCKTPCECVETTFLSAVPAMVWIILLFFDGHYFACAMNPWSGRYVKVDEGALQKWCKPSSLNSSELNIKTQELFFRSKGIGLTFFGILTFGLGMYLMISCKCCKKEEDAKGEGDSIRGNQGPEASGLTSSNQDTDV